MYRFLFLKSYTFNILQFNKEIVLAKFITSIKNYNVLPIKGVFQILIRFFFIKLHNFEAKSVFFTLVPRCFSQNAGSKYPRGKIS